MACVVVMLVLVVVCGVSAAPDSCSAVRNVYQRQGFTDEVPPVPIPGDHLLMCQADTTCCTDVMERKLSIESRQEFDNNLKEIMNPMANLLNKKNAKFDELFRRMLNLSRTNFDDMFQRTYGILYQQNAEVFTSLYNDLEAYYTSGKVDLQDVMDGFFKELYQRMFKVFNSQYTFSPKYLRCVTRHMEELQPFRDVPKKLTLQIKRSFVALRTFVQGLATGRDVVKNVLKVNPSVNCVHELMRMSHCSTCAGHQAVHPCLPYCQDVMQLCLAHHQPLIAHWTQYISAMVELGERLENPFNIENVVEPVNFKISDAIMNFQEAGNDISTKVFEGCGAPKLGRRKRSGEGGELYLEFLDFNERTADEKTSRDTDNFSISRHIHEIKTKIKNARNFWSELPTKMCKDASRQGTASCWTGTKLGMYEGKSSSVAEPHHSSALDQQVMRLKVITSKLGEAYHGRDVSWIDDEYWLGSGSRADEEGEGEEEGSGSGGWHPTGRYPIDDEDGYIGSGDGGIEEAPHNPYIIGGGRDIGREGSGHHGGGGHTPYNPRNFDNPYEPIVPKKNIPNNKNAPESPEQPPSAAAKETMSLMRAVTIYMLPAFIMFLGTLA